METVKVALIGFGTIGSGVARLLLEHGDRLARGAGKKMELSYVVDKDLTRERNITLPEGLLTDDLDRVLDDPKVDVVIELVGGTGVAKTIVLRALQNGKNVVTANKALLATHGRELFERARQSDRTIAFEAAVAGGIPVIGVVGQNLAANRIESIRAILNGTCNFILTQMEQHGLDYGDVVAEAQRLGYAEADPTMDVEGIDATQKLTILVQLAFGATVDWKDVSRVGIDLLSTKDIQVANEKGCVIRLIGTAERSPDGVSLCVSPTLVPKGTPLAGVQGAFNAVQVVGDFVGPLFLQGLGAGQNATASAVVADLIDTVAGRTAITFAAQKLWSDENGEAAVMRDPMEMSGRYYLRFDIEKQTDAQLQVADILSQHGVFADLDAAVQEVVQYDDEENSERASLVVTTGQTTEGRVLAAVGQIEKLPFVQTRATRCRVAE